MCIAGLRQGLSQLRRRHVLLLLLLLLRKAVQGAVLLEDGRVRGGCCEVALQNILQPRARRPERRRIPARAVHALLLCPTQGPGKCQKSAQA